MGKITENISSILKEHIARKAPFAVYRLPGERQLYFIAGNCEPYNEARNQSGFVFHPFVADAQTPALFIKAEHYFAINMDELLQAHFSASEVCGEPAINREVTENEFCAQVEKAVKTIKKGGLEKVILSRVQRVEVNKPWIKLFAELADKYPSAFVSLVVVPGKVAWLTATPELLVSSDGDMIQTVSLAGTKAAHANTEWGDKEKTEQQIVTAYINDILQQHCTAIITDSPRDLVAGNVMHLQTGFKAKLKSGLWQLVNEMHPTPAVCGLPKDKAIAFIKDTELHCRNYYAGFLGPCNMGGKTNLYVNLRCAELQPGYAAIFAGGGITAASVPEQEWKETVMKAGTLMSVFETAKEKIV